MDAQIARERAELRTKFKALRRAIPKAARAAAALKVAQHLSRALPLKPGLRVAVSASLRVELDTAPLIARLRRRGCALYVPRIVSRRHHRMRFVPLRGSL